MNTLFSRSGKFFTLVALLVVGASFGAALLQRNINPAAAQVAFKACDLNAVGTNQFIGCVWKDGNGNGIYDPGTDLIVGPARTNAAVAFDLTCPGCSAHSDTLQLGSWGFSYHHYGCCQLFLNHQVFPGTCFGAQSCNLIGTQPLRVEGVTGFGDQDPIENAGATWQGNYDIPAGVIFFSASTDDGIRVYVDGLQIISGGPHASSFDVAEKTFQTAGTHLIKLEYWNGCCDDSIQLQMIEENPYVGITPRQASVAVGQSVQFLSSYDPDGPSGLATTGGYYAHYVNKPATDITANTTWSSSNNAIAAPTAIKGKFMAMAPGTVTITPSYTDSFGRVMGSDGVLPREVAVLTVTGGTTPGSNACTADTQCASNQRCDTLALASNTTACGCVVGSRPGTCVSTSTPPPPPPVFGGACTNPSPALAGYALPCPVLNVTPATVGPTQAFNVQVTKGAISYIYRTIYVSEGGTWKKVSDGLQPASTYAGWATTDASYSATPQSLGLTAGAHFVAQWDWTYDTARSTAANPCWIGPGGSVCGGSDAKWRVQKFTVQ